MEKRGRDKGIDQGGKEKRPSKSPRKQNRSRTAVRDDSTSPPPLPTSPSADPRPHAAPEKSQGQSESLAVAKGSAEANLGIEQHDTMPHPQIHSMRTIGTSYEHGSSIFEPYLNIGQSPAAQQISRQSGIVQQHALSPQHVNPRQLSDFPGPSKSSTGGVSLPSDARMAADQKRERKSGKTFSERISNEQVHRLLQLNEKHAHLKYGRWDTITADWKSEFPDNDVERGTLRYIFGQLNEGDRCSEAFKAAMDAEIPIPKRGAPIGKARYPAPKNWNFQDEHAEFLTEVHSSYESWLDLTAAFTERFPEMADITPETLERLSKKHGCISGSGMRQYTDEEKLFALKQSELVGGRDMSSEDKGRIVREFREKFSKPNFTEHRLYMLLWKLRDRNSQDLEKLMLHQQQQTAAKREKRRQRLKENKSKRLRKAIWRAQLDLEILKVYNNAAKDESVAAKFTKIQLTSAYRQCYTQDKPPQPSILSTRASVLRSKSIDVEKLESQINDLVEQLVSDDDDDDNDNKEDDDDENDIEEDEVETDDFDEALTIETRTT